MEKAKGGKKQRKYSRNKDYCTAYLNENKREKNKIKRIQRHMKRFPLDTGAMAHIERLRDVIKGGNYARSQRQ